MQPLRALTRMRYSTSASSSRWTARAAGDSKSKAAKLAQYKSRAVYKLLELDERFQLFAPGMTVVDLGYAPGSWMQVAAERTRPNGRVLGIDVIPAQPPKRTSTIQGNFLSPGVQASARRFLSDPDRGRARDLSIFRDGEAEEKDVEEAGRGYIQRERMMSENEAGGEDGQKSDGRASVDVVLSDMSEPWPLVDGWWKKTLNVPHTRMMNTSGIRLKDHTGSMELCHAALHFCLDVLKPGGSFVCKFYQGDDSKFLEAKVKAVFTKYTYYKPPTSRPESRECYIVGQKMLKSVNKTEITSMPITREYQEDSTP